MTTTHETTVDQFKVYTRRDLTALGYGSTATLDRRIKDGTFPKPLRLGGRDVWTTSMLRQLLGETA